MSPEDLKPVGEIIDVAISHIPEKVVQKIAGDIWLQRGGGSSTPEQQKDDWVKAKAELALKQR